MSKLLSILAVLLLAGFPLMAQSSRVTPDLSQRIPEQSTERGANLLYEPLTIPPVTTGSFLPKVDDVWSFKQNLNALSESDYHRPPDFETQEVRASQHKTIGLILMIGGVCLGVGGVAWMISGLEANPYDTNYSTTMLAVYGGSAVTSVGITAMVVGLALFMQGSRGE